MSGNSNNGNLTYFVKVRCPKKDCGCTLERSSTRSEQEADLLALEDIQNHMISCHGDYTPSAEIRVYRPRRRKVKTEV